MTDSPSIASSRLRLVLRANAATSIIGGGIALVAGSWVSRELGIDHVLLTRLLGAGLVLFAVQVLRVAAASEHRLLSDALLVSLGDAAWVIGTVAVVASGVLTTSGTVVAIVVGLFVADFGIAQLVLRNQARGADRAVRPVAA